MTIYFELPLPAVIRRASERLLRRVKASRRLTAIVTRLGFEIVV